MKMRSRPFVATLLALALTIPAVLLGASPALAARAVTDIEKLTLQLASEFSNSAAGPEASVSVTARLYTYNTNDTFETGSLAGEEASFNRALEIDFDVESIFLDGRANRSSPDLRCTILQGESECTVTVPSGGETGTSNIRAWIDRDGRDGDEGGVAEADPTEARFSSANSGTEPYANDCLGSDGNDGSACRGGTPFAGQTPEPDQTDVGSIGFFKVGASTLTCVEVASGRRGTATAPVQLGQDEDATWRCTARNSGGGAIAGRPIDAELLQIGGTNGGANDPDGSSQSNTTADYDYNVDPDNPFPPQSGCLTDQSGSCDIVISGQISGRSPELGTTRICFWGDMETTGSGATMTKGDSGYAPTGSSDDGGDCLANPANILSPTTNSFVAWQEAVGSDATPETQTIERGGDATIKASLFDLNGDPSFGFPKPKVFAEVFSGSATDLDGNTPNTPDYTFPTVKNAESFTTLTFPANIVGTITLCVWTAQTPTMSGVSNGTETNAPTCTGKAGSEGAGDASADNGTPSPARDNTDIVVRTVTGPPPPPPAPDSGYWIADDTATVFARNAPQLGNGGLSSSTKAVGIAAKGKDGYWMVGADGSVAAKGSAVNYGNAATIPLQAPIVGMAARPQGDGYWLLGRDGGIFSFGTNTKFHGSTGGMQLNQPVVGIAATPTGEGYWLVASDGGIFSFGDAIFHGSMGAVKLNKPVVGMTGTPGGGYWMVASDGGIFSFGPGAGFHGSAGSMVLQKPIVGISARKDGNGYWMVASDGGIFSFDASFHGSAAGAATAPVVGMASFGST